MADITVATVALLKQRILRGSPGGVRINTLRFTWATGEYLTATGLPIATSSSTVKKSVCGMQQTLDHIVIIEGEADLGYLIKYDYDSQLFRMYAVGGSAAHTHDLAIGTAGSTNTTDQVSALGVSILAPTSVIVAGKTTTTAAATSGGVLNNTADVTTGGTELTNSTTVAEIMIVVQAWGY